MRIQLGAHLKIPRTHRRDAGATPLVGWTPGFAAVAVLCAQAAASAAPKPNILLIFSDDQGYGDLHCYGSEFPTPQLDSLAREGLRFTDWYVAAPVCTPSRFALLTGRNPTRSHDHLIGPLMFGQTRSAEMGIRPDETTFAELLQANGYRTALVGKWHLGHGHPEFLPTRHGFDSFYGFTAGCIDYFTLRYGNTPNWYRGESLLEEKGYATDLLTDEAVRFIRSTTEQPFFLYLAYNAPHYGKGWNAERKQQTNVVQACPSEGTQLASISDPKRRAYASTVMCMDTGIGRVLKALREAGREQSTLVIFMSDNGGDPNFGGRNSPLHGGKASLYEGGIRVPCLMRWPGRIRTGVTDQVGSALDVFPTVCALTGITADAKTLDGTDLTPFLLHEQIQPRTLKWETIGSRAVRDGHWKYIDVKGKEMLFDLEHDIGEQKDVASERPEFTRSFRATFRNSGATSQPTVR